MAQKIWLAISIKLDLRTCLASSSILAGCLILWRRAISLITLFTSAFLNAISVLQGLGKHCIALELLYNTRLDK